jgi:hypothetical protein
METKAWYLSKTVWGAAIAIIAQVLILLGVFAPSIDTTDLQQKVNDPTTVDQILNLLTIVASAVAVFGRVKADKELTK